METEKITLEHILSKNSFDNRSESYRYNNCDELINSSIENEELEFFQSGNIFRCNYEKHADITSALSMCIFFYSDLNEILDNCKYVVKVNDITIINCSLRTITQFDRMMIYDKFTIIKLPNDWLIGKFITIASSSSIMCIEIQSDNAYITNKINKIMLNYEMIYYENFERCWLATHNHIIKFQQLEEIPLLCNDDNNATFIVKSESSHRGYFIECSNLSSIQNICMQMTNIYDYKKVNRFNYSKWMILANTVRVSNNMIYLPINNNFDYKEISKRSLVGGTFVDTKDKLYKEPQFILTYEDKYIKTKIYSLCINHMIYENGIVTTKTNINTF